MAAPPTTRQPLSTTSNPSFTTVIAGGVTIPDGLTRTYTAPISSVAGWWTESNQNILTGVWTGLSPSGATNTTNSSEISFPSGWLKTNNDTGTYVCKFWVDIGDAETFVGTEIRLRWTGTTTLTPDEEDVETTHIDISTNVPQRFYHTAVLRLSTGALLRGQIQHDHGSTLTIDGHGGYIMRTGDI